MARNPPKTAKKPPPVHKKKGGARAGAGRKPFEPTPDQRRIVMLASGIGMKQAHIVKLITDAAGKPIDAKTLRERFREELDTGIARTHLNVGKSLYDQAVGIPQMETRRDAKGNEYQVQTGWVKEPNVAAAIWFSKAQMKWKDRTTLELADIEAIINSLGGNIEALRVARAAGDTG